MAGWIRRRIGSEREAGMRTRLRVLLGTVVLVGLVAAAITIPLVRTAKAGPPPPSFAGTPLLLSAGSSESDISSGNGGTMAMVSLQWLFDPTAFGTHLWTGPFGAVPTHQGIVDGALQHPGKTVFGAGDADVDIGSTGRLHISTLIFLENPTFRRAQLGVSAITCPSPASGTFSIGQCTPQIIDTTTDDRPWITSDGSHVYISYHDAGNSSLIHVQRSDDDGFTWRRVGGPLLGHEGITTHSPFHKLLG